MSSKKIIVNADTGQGHQGRPVLCTCSQDPSDSSSGNQFSTSLERGSGTLRAHVADLGLKDHWYSVGLSPLLKGTPQSGVLFPARPT